MQRLAILGAGKIGESLLAGLLSSGWSDVVVTSRRQERVDELRDRHGVEATTSNADAIRGAAVVVVAVKPQDLDVLLAEIAPDQGPGAHPKRLTASAARRRKGPAIHGDAWVPSDSGPTTV